MVATDISRKARAKWWDSLSDNEKKARATKAARARWDKKKK